MPELVAEHVGFGFGGRSLFKDINITVRTGEMLICIGANASGKTTLLRLLSGLLLPSAGDVYIRDLVLSSPLGQVGILFQNPDHQMIAATVEEEIALGLELRGVKTNLIGARVEETLLRFHLDEFRQRPPQSLSGGQKQRLALAAIMVLKPHFLLLDEPDSFLDAPSRRELFDGIDSIRSECGILWTTPLPRRAPQSEKWLMLHDGILEESTQHDISILTETIAS